MANTYIVGTVDDTNIGYTDEGGPISYTVAVSGMGPLQSSYGETATVTFF